MSQKEEKNEDNRQPPSAHQWAEARAKNPDDFNEEETRESTMKERKAESKDVTSHLKADADPSAQPKDKNGLARA